MATAAGSARAYAHAGSNETAASEGRMVAVGVTGWERLEVGGEV